MAGRWKIVRDTALRFVDKDPLTLAASIAFYTALSFAPIIVLSLSLAAWLWPGSQDRLVAQLGSVLGPQIREVAATVAKNASLSLAGAAGIVNAVALLVSATTAFAQLQAALNAIWGVAAPPSNAVWVWLQQRLLSVGMIVSIGFLLTVALVLSTALAVVFTSEGIGWTLVNEGISVVVLSSAFAALYRFLSNARPPWRAVAVGGLATAALFEIGKWGLGLYLASTDAGDAYGAAGSIILMLVWVYYSSLIVLVGAAVTQALAQRLGQPVQDEVPDAQPAEERGQDPDAAPG